MAKSRRLKVEDFVVSTEEFCTFLHRDIPKCVDRTFRTGLVCGPDLQSTATWQPREVERAMGWYRAWGDYGSAVIVIRIPRRIWEDTRKESRGDEVMDERIGYLHPERRNYAVKPEFVVASINRETDEVTLNPYRKK